MSSPLFARKLLITYLCHVSHSLLTYHLVFGTFHRLPAIDIAHERELYKCLLKLANDRGVFIRRIGGMPDHVHILCDIPPTVAVSSFVKILKSESSKFMRINPHFPLWSGWAEGFGAFTVDSSTIDVRVKYIMNQKQHHQNVPFAVEYRQFLAECGFSDDTPILGEP